MLREGRLPTSSSPGSPPPSPQIRQTSIKNYFQTDSRRTFERYEVGSGAETRSGPELRSRFGFGFEQSLGDDKSDNEPPERSALNHQPVPMDIMQSQYKLINDSSYPSRALGPYDSEMESPFTNPSAFAAPYAPALKANLSSSIRPTWKYPSPSVSLKLRLAPITLDTVSLLRILNATLFPVQYNEKFYKDVLDTHNDLCWLAFYEEKCVGAICCRRERVGDLWGDISFGAPTPLPQPPRGIVNTNHGQFLGRRGGFGDGGGAGGVERLYIMTLGVLAPFRRTGIGGCPFFSFYYSTDQLLV